MAVLGAQLVFSLIIFSFLQKLSPYLSFGRWLLVGRLVRYLHPSEEDLKRAAGTPSNYQGRGKGKRGDNKKNHKDSTDNNFTIPRQIDIALDTARVEAVDLLQLRFYPDYQWLVDFSLSAGVVYFLTEMYYTIGPRSEFNISILWCMLVIGFSLRVLFAQTAMYFKLENGGERILCVTFAFFFLVAAMGVLVVDESILEFGLVEGYENFSTGAKNFLKHQDVDYEGPVSFLTFKIILAFVCSVVGALLTFPGLRYGKLHIDALKYSRENRIKQLFLHLNFILPLVIIVMWIKPLGRTMLCGKHWQATYKHLQESQFDILRLLLIGIMFLLRLCLMPTHLQAHLNTAYEKVENLKKESGRISGMEFQKLIARIFYYLCVVTLQYLTPVILLLFLMFLQKTLGEYSWSSILGKDLEEYFTSLSKTTDSDSVITGSLNSTTIESISETAAQFSLSLVNLRQVFSAQWYRGLISFVTWWVCTSWFTTSAFGMYYHSTMGSS
ncbi:transmembrane protein 161B-like isoform X2 [Ostrea edulis]|nr:transmembrane protein 161B-like isoform X2 [Ostrea edulis]